MPPPGYTVYGLAAPALRPARVTESWQRGGAWELVMLSYGDPLAGPYVQVITAAPGVRPSAGRAVEPDGTERAEPWEPPGSAVAAREQLPAGDALVTRHGDRWSARLLEVPATVTVTVIGQGVAPGDVRLEPLPDLRPVLDTQYKEQYEELLRRLRQAGRRPLPRPAEPELDPAEGTAAVRALADFTLATQTELRATVPTRSGPRHPPGWGPMHSALWRRAVREYQRLSGAGPRAADDVVTEVINHLGQLADELPWFTADERRREAATDETVRHAVLGDIVPSEPAQRAWSRYWSGRLERVGPDPADPDAALARHQALRALEADWRAAWQEWARQAPGTGGA